MKKYFFILIYFLSLYPLFSQKQKSDSLLFLLKKSKVDTQKVKLLVAVAQELQYVGGDSKKYSEDALALSEKLNYTYGKALSLYSLGRYNYYVSDYSASLENNKQGYELYKQVNFSDGMAYCLMSIGDAHYSMDDFSEAILFYDSSISIFQKIKNEVGVANCLMSKGDVFYVQDNYQYALLNYKRALEFFEKNNSALGIANCINCIADVLYDQTDFPQAKEKYQKAKSLFEKINDLLGLGNCTKRLGDIEFRTDDFDAALKLYNEAYRYYSESGSINGLGNTIRNLGEVFMKQKNYFSAIEKMNEAIAIFNKTGDGMGLADCYNNLAVIKNEEGKIKEAIQFANKGFDIAKEIGTPEIMQVSAFELGKLYSKIKNFEKAFYYQKIYTDLNDSINSNENVKKITRLQMQIDFEQKQREQELLQKQKQMEHEMELQRQKTVRNSFIAGFSALLLLLFFIYKNYRNKQKANLLLAEQNKIIELKNREITDSIEYAQHIQKAMLVSDDVLQGIFPEHFVLFKPRDIISGDFYWAHKIVGSRKFGVGRRKDNSELLTAFSGLRTPISKLIWAVADCTGHGVPGALRSMIGNTLLNKIVVDNKIENPSEILNHLRNGVIEILHQKGGLKDSKDGMDMAVCALQKMEDGRWKMEFAGAHNPVWIIRKSLESRVQSSETGHPASDGMSQPLRQPTTNYQLPTKLIELKPDNFPVGFFYGEKKSFTNHSAEVRKGDMIYLLSDGFADQFGGAKGKKFKQSRLKELLVSIAEKSMTEQKEILNNTFENWKNELEQVDDITIVGVRVCVMESTAK